LGDCKSELERLTARVLLVDEADAMEAETEGNPIRIAERRTLSFANRKIILGSTPLFEDTSHVLRSYAESDARVFEIGCISLSASRPEGRPAEAHCVCPSCGAVPLSPLCPCSFQRSYLDVLVMLPC
jgi:phage terminase large subunit GpA-like protein